MNQDPAKLSLSNFLARETSDPLQAAARIYALDATGRMAVELYEPELLASGRRAHDHRLQRAAALGHQSLFLQLSRAWQIIRKSSPQRRKRSRTHGLGACGSPMLSGMTDLHRELERQVAKFLGREDAMLFNSGFGGALGTISGLLRKSDVAILDNRSHLSLRDGAVLSRCRADKFEHNDPGIARAALARKRLAANSW